MSVKIVIPSRRKSSWPELKSRMAELHWKHWTPITIVVLLLALLAIASRVLLYLPSDAIDPKTAEGIVVAVVGFVALLLIIVVAVVVSVWLGNRDKKKEGVRGTDS